MATQRNWFAIVTAVIAVALGFLLVMGRSPAWYVLPVLLGGATYLLARRLRKGTEAQITRHVYALSAPAARGRVADLVESLSRRGYQPAVHTLTEVGETGPAPASDTALAGAQIGVVDKRASAELGVVNLRLRVEESGHMVGFVEADDTGPGVYDEMAQFLILDMASVIEGLEYLKMGGQDTARRPATALKAELPEKPYGLGLL